VAIICRILNHEFRPKRSAEAFHELESEATQSVAMGNDNLFDTS